MHRQRQRTVDRLNDYNYRYGKTDIVEEDGETYLFQGDTDDELIMFRQVDTLLECERDAVQQMILEQEDDKK